MSEKVNYFKIGLFFIISVTLLTVTVVIWGAGLFTKDKIYFETYFDTPVTGLAVGASVELMGVKLGRVEDIDFVPAVYDIPINSEIVSRYERYIRVLCSISEEEAKEQAGDITVEQRKARTKNLIQQGLRLRLASNLLTGQAYLEGVFVDPNRFPILPIIWEPRHTYVASAPGEFSTIKDSIDQILEKLEEIEFQKIVDNVNQLLVAARETVEDANVPSLTGEMKSFVTELRGTNHRVQQIVEDANVPGVAGEIENLFAELRGTNQHLQKLLEKPEKTESEMTNIAVMIAQLNKTLMRIDKLVLTQTPKIEQAMEDFRRVSTNLKELTDSIKQHPSQLIFSQPPSKSEVSK